MRAQLFEFERFDQGQELVVSVQSGEIVTTSSIQETQLEEVDVEKAKKGSPRQTTGGPLQKATPAHPKVLRSLFRPGQGEPQMRFPIGVAVVFLNEARVVGR